MRKVVSISGREKPVGVCRACIGFLGSIRCQWCGLLSMIQDGGPVPLPLLPRPRSSAPGAAARAPHSLYLDGPCTESNEPSTAGGRELEGSQPAPLLVLI